MVLGVALAMTVPVQAEGVVSSHPQIKQQPFMVLAQGQSNKKCTQSEKDQCSDSFTACQNALFAKYGVGGTGPDIGKDTAKCNRTASQCYKKCGGL